METLKFLLTTTFYPPYHIGGDAVHVKYLAEELVKKGHQVHVLHSLDAYRIKRRFSPKETEESEVNVHPIQTSFNISSYAAYFLGSSRSVMKKFEDLVRGVKPDVVHHHNISLLGYNILKKRENYLNLYTCHDYWLVCQQNNLLRDGMKQCTNKSCFCCALMCKRPPQLWRYTRNFKEVVKEIDVLITPSNYVKDKILQEINVDAFIVPNFVPKPSYIVGSCEFSNFFLYAGVLEKHKGILRLMEVFEKNTERINSKLLVVGHGSLENRIRHFIRAKKLENKIIFLGWVERGFLFQLLTNATALILPSIWPENSPLIALEAISVGTPVIASNQGGLPEIVRYIDKKLLFETSIGLEKILLQFHKKKYKREKIEQIHERHFSPHSYMKRYVDVILRSHITKNISLTRACGIEEVLR